MNEELPVYIDLIKKVFPITIAKVDVHDIGDDFLVIEINSSWMFRFPRNDSSKKAMEKEIRFLSRLKNMSQLAIPDYQYIGGNFGGYPKIQGAPLSFEFYQGLSIENQKKIAQHIGYILSAIHCFPLKDVAGIGIAMGWDGARQNAGVYFLEHIAPLLSSTTRKNSTACMETLLAEKFESKVIHGDFYLPDHAFVDESNYKLGVIDFTDVTIFDPAHDFQCIVEIGGDEFFELVLNYYHGERKIPHCSIDQNCV
jgi:aminoglycoside 2''-phosphotransferase